MSLRLAFVTGNVAAGPANWSGGKTAIREALKRHDVAPESHADSKSFISSSSSPSAVALSSHDRAFLRNRAATGA
ncbi:hypothetical protein BST61_g1005 [Cercospora zeina]